MCSIGGNIHSTLLVHQCVVLVQIHTVQYWCIGVQYWCKYTLYIIGALVGVVCGRNKGAPAATKAPTSHLKSFHDDIIIIFMITDDDKHDDGVDESGGGLTRRRGHTLRF